tara:strand:- start:124 stop:429 length:306 start_codon:yes stop_codon:yes gene_type:complete
MFKFENKVERVSIHVNATTQHDFYGMNYLSASENNDMVYINIKGVDSIGKVEEASIFLDCHQANILKTILEEQLEDIKLKRFKENQINSSYFSENISECNA